MGQVPRGLIGSGIPVSFGRCKGTLEISVSSLIFPFLNLLPTPVKQKYLCFMLHGGFGEEPQQNGSSVTLYTTVDN